MQGPSFFRLFMQTGSWMVLAFLVVPMLVVLPVSLTGNSYISLPDGEISWQHYQNYFTDAEWIGATWTSIWIALVTVVIATVLGTAFSIGAWLLSDTWSTIARWILITPILVPPVVQSLGFYRFWVKLGLIDTHVGVILAHTLLALPYVSITVFAALAGLDRRIVQAARGLGASVWLTTVSIIVPSARAGIIAGAVFAFIVSFDEIVGVLFITVRNVQTLPKMIWQGINESIDPTIAAVATILTVITIAIMFVVTWRRQA
jgi:putative spermidine/putrescine transport system permease protein